jgi:hypothetical protein
MRVEAPARRVTDAEFVASRRLDILVNTEDRLRAAGEALGPDAVESPLLRPVFAHLLAQLCLVRHLRGHVEAEFEVPA